jgi:multiple sugar transport system permease protein
MRLTSRNRALREALTGYLFILPATLLIGVFGLFPIGYSFYMSLYRWRVAKGRFIGLEHYLDSFGSWAAGAAFFGGLALILFAHQLWTSASNPNSDPSKIRVFKLAGSFVLLAAGTSVALGWRVLMREGDDRFWSGLIITLFYAFGTIPLQIILALLIALLLHQKLRGRSLFRIIFFLPYITPLVASAVVFSVIFSRRETSLANSAMTALGLPMQTWLAESSAITELWGLNLPGLWAGPSLALVSIILFGVWTYVGWNIVVFLAGLADIPKDLYEAAQIDGAGPVANFWHITVPLLSPVTFYLVLLGFIGTFQAFSQLFVMRTPFAQDSVDTASLIIFDSFYRSNNFSLAAAQSIILFLLILGFTLFQQRVLGRKVFYG